jgi:hypothetical protein
MSSKAICKSSLDELIRLTRKYQRTSDTDILPARISVMKELSLNTLGSDYHWCAFGDIVYAVCGSLKRGASNQDIYDVFNLLGYEVKGEGK